MISRRQFIKYTAAASAGFLLERAAGGLLEAAYAASPALTPFVDALPVPGAFSPVGTFDGTPLYEIAASQFTQKLHRDLPATPLWGYGGTYPAASLEARTGQPITVKWVNNLPGTHLLQASVDHTVDGTMMGEPDVRMVTHLHGGNVPALFDGYPMDWFTPGNAKWDQYPNIQPATTLWFHDHSMGLTRLNVMAGLAGFYLLRDDVEDSLNLPKGAYEIPLVIQDRQFNANGTLFYPTAGNNPTVHPQWNPEFFGDVALVNGKVWPFLQVEPRKYRFRILNGSGARFYNIQVTNGALINPNLTLQQIGSEGGLFAAPVPLTQILLAPGERADVILDFSGSNGQALTMTNNAPAPYPAGGAGPAINNIMQFQVTKPLAGADKSALPAALRPLYRIPEGSAVGTRDLTLNEVLHPVSGTPTMLLLNNTTFDKPITESPRLGTTEIWRIINLTVDTHPIHLHLVQFQILDRQPFNVAQYQNNGQLVFTGAATPPAPNETGWKDTFRANPGEVTRIIARFGSYPGTFVWHCHILEHEDNDMMRPFSSMPSKFYFAEGTCRPGFEPYITIQNPDPGSDAAVNITYLLGNGTPQVQSVTVPKNSRATIYVKGFLGEIGDFSAIVESVNGVQCIAERVMYFDYSGWTGGHASTGAATSALAWYFAEGTTRPGYDPYFTILNPRPTAANMQITYVLGDGTTKVQTLTVPANSRGTVRAKDFLGVANDVAHDFSAKVESLNNVRVVVERATYFDHGGWTGGHAVPGALGGSPVWYFAEGTCRPNFDPFITIMNPDTVSGATVDITYMKGDGTSKTQTVNVARTSRATVRVKDVLGEANDAAHDFSARVEARNGVGIVVERVMYFNYNGMTGGSCTMGGVLPNHTFYFAEGSCRPSFHPFITVMNPDPKVPAQVRITYFLGDGTSQVQSLTVAPNARGTVVVKAFLGEGEDISHDFSAKVECTNGPWIVVERPVYFDYAGWTGGHSVMGLAY